MVAVDFSAWAKLRPPEHLGHLQRWYKDVSTRPMSGISKSLLGGVDSVPLDPPQPGFNDGSFFRAPAHQRRIGLQFFKVAAYRNDVGNRRTAIEFEYRNHAIRVQGTECWRELFAVAQIN